jgi:formylglycine-generating enzyme required for sulfatase activity
MQQVFLSYNRADQIQARALDAWLQTQGINTFFDQRELGSGQLWLPDLEKAIQTNVESIAVLVGPHGLGNTQHYEVQLAITRQAREPGFPVIPVILPGTPEHLWPGGFLGLPTWVIFGATQGISEDPAALQRLLAAIRRERLDDDSIRGTFCPYKGLQHFDEDDARLFLGREAETEALHATIQQHRVGAIIGRSGSGKSSLALAGLLPRLRQRGAKGWDGVWDTLVLRPEREPLAELANALEPKRAEEEDLRREDRMLRLANEVLIDAREDLLAGFLERRLAQSQLKANRLLIVVDQGEKLFEIPREEHDHARFRAHSEKFLSMLLWAARHGPASLVLTIRSDYFDPLQHSPFGPFLKDTQVLLGRVQDLRPCIEVPANLVGLRFSPGLVDRILGEVGDDEANLPLLQHALKRTWLKSGELKQRPLLTNDAYVAAGGVAQAINQDAQDCFDGLSAPEQDAARRLFLRLVRPGDGGAHTRQRAALPADQMERAVVSAFASSRRRLLFVGARDGNASVEVAHEALIRGWSTLLEWVETSREKLRTRSDVLAWIAQNTRGGTLPELIPAGGLLSRARDLVAAPGEVPVDDIRDFITESARRVDLATKSELRQAKQRALIFAGLASLSFIFAAGAGLFWWQAKQQQDIAEANLAVAETTAQTMIYNLSRGRDNEGVPPLVVQGILEAADGTLSRLGTRGGMGLLELRAVGLAELGVTRWMRSDWQGAKMALEQALVLRRQLAQAAPDDLDHRREIALAHERMAEILQSLGLPQEALVALQSATTEREAIISSLPEASGPKQALLRTIALTIDLLLADGNRDLARVSAQNALSIGASLRDMAGNTAAAANWQQAVVLARRVGLLPAPDTGYPAAIGETFRDCVDCPEMVVIPPGRFRIGSDDGNVNEWNGPEVEVATLAVGRTEVTFAELDICIASGGCPYRSDDWGWGRGQRPAILISWADANAYAQWLSKRTGHEYRLLSEAEWEYAARGRTDGVSTRWFWGDDASEQCRYANGADQVAQRDSPTLAHWRQLAERFSLCSDGYAHTSPVASFLPNGFGLFDMAGNVREWVQDCWTDHYRDLPLDGSARPDPANCTRRTVRGGAWSNPPQWLRSAARDWTSTNLRLNTNGFRVARVPRN